MKQTFYDCEQGSEEWFELRRGIVTASMFDAVMAKGRGNSESLTRRKYMLTLIGERLTGETQDSYTNTHMDRGKIMEAEARELYSMVSRNEVKQIGFIKFGDDIGASPDGIIMKDGCLEIKTKLPHLHLDCLLRDEVPSEHIKQIQGQLWVADRQWCDFVSYWPSLPIFIKRIERDNEHISKISNAVSDFLQQMYGLMDKISG